MPPLGAAKPVQPQVRVKCTFNDCDLIFNSEKEMIRHKIAEVHHEYCKKCNLDFDNFDQHFLHKLANAIHIVCPVCSELFKSEGGRDAHVRQVNSKPSQAGLAISICILMFHQFHQSDQSLTCAGCSGHFTRAAALMQHIETGACDGLRPEALKRHTAGISLMNEREGWKEAIDGRKPEPQTTLRVKKPSGGVPLNDATNFPKLGDQPASVVSPSSSRPSKASSTTSSSVSATEIPSMAPGGGVMLDENGSTISNNTGISRDLMTFSDLSISSKQKGKQSAPAREKAANPIMKYGGPGTRPPWERPVQPSSTQIQRARETQEVVPAAPVAQESKFEVEKFFNEMTARFDCVCGATFATEGAFISHITTSPRHQYRHISYVFYNLMIPSRYILLTDLTSLVVLHAIRYSRLPQL